MAEVSTFSFHGTKNITTGEGGAFVTNDNELAEKIKIARDKGTDKWNFLSNHKRKGFYEYISIGNSYVQSNLLGALCITQLRKVDRINQRRKKIAEYYSKELSLVENINLPIKTKNSDVNFHLYYLLVPPDKKDWIIKAINEEGITANVHYTPLHMNSYYKDLGTDSDLQNSLKFYNSFIRIPIYYSLSYDDIVDIVNAIKKVCSS